MVSMLGVARSTSSAVSAFRVGLIPQQVKLFQRPASSVTCISLQAARHFHAKTSLTMVHKFKSGGYFQLPLSRGGTIRFYFNRRKAVQGGAGIKAQTVGIQKETTSRVNQLARIFKYSRIPFLIVAIYGLGYQQGVIDTVRNPKKLQESLFESICWEIGIQDKEEIDIISERMPYNVAPRPRGLLRSDYGAAPDPNGSTGHDKRTMLVAGVGRDIIRAARKFIRSKLDESKANAREEVLKQHFTKKLDPQDLQKMILEDQTVRMWEEAAMRIEGEGADGIKNWEFVLLATPIPNAFVTEMLPQKVFVTTGLFEEFVDNTDELALILGHEISHLIMGHGSKASFTTYMLRG